MSLGAAAATALVFSIRNAESLMVVSECKSAMKKKDSFSLFLDNSIAGIIAPKRLPKCGLPELWIPVSIRAIQ